MTKKTFEKTIKIIITSADLIKVVGWGIRGIELVDEKVFNKFLKSYDWDSVLNSPKFAKFISKNVTGEDYGDEICDQYFVDNDKEWNKIKSAYDKFVAENKKKEPILTVEYRVVLHGTKSQLEEARSYIKDMNVVVVIEAL